MWGVSHGQLIVFITLVCSQKEGTPDRRAVAGDTLELPWMKTMKMMLMTIFYGGIGTKCTESQNSNAKQQDDDDDDDNGDTRRSDHKATNGANNTNNTSTSDRRADSDNRPDEDEEDAKDGYKTNSSGRTTNAKAIDNKNNNMASLEGINYRGSWNQHKKPVDKATTARTAAEDGLVNDGRRRMPPMDTNDGDGKDDGTRHHGTNRRRHQLMPLTDDGIIRWHHQYQRPMESRHGINRWNQPMESTDGINRTATKGHNKQGRMTMMGTAGIPSATGTLDRKTSQASPKACLYNQRQTLTA
jgi:hypothetical protein